MVILNVNLVIKKGMKWNHHESIDEKEERLKKQTHLYLQHQGITDIADDLSICKNLRVLYLQDNVLENVTKLKCIHLTCLYLQNNNVKYIEDIGNLIHLRELYLGHNCITTLSGLEKMTKLEELHLEKQKNPPSVKLAFDIKSIMGIKQSLKVLVISGNNLESITPLLPLENLEILRALDNKFCSMSELASVLQNWTQLKELNLQGNPICSRLRYREGVIAASYHSLNLLDGKEILSVNRSFLQSLALRQASRKMQPFSATRASMHDSEGRSRNQSLQLALNSKHCTRLPDITPENEQNPFFGSHFPAWTSGKCRSAKQSTPEHVVRNWIPQSAGAVGRRKSCSSSSTDLSHNLHISRL